MGWKTRLTQFQDKWFFKAGSIIYWSVRFTLTHSLFTTCIFVMKEHGQFTIFVHNEDKLFQSYGKFKIVRKLPQRIYHEFINIFSSNTPCLLPFSWEEPLTRLPLLNFGFWIKLEPRTFTTTHTRHRCFQKL